MAEDKITNLYNAFVNSGYSMEPENEFRENLKDPTKRKAAYDALVNNGYKMEPYDEFETNIGFGQPAQPAQAETTAPAPATTTGQEQPATAAPAPASQQAGDDGYKTYTWNRALDLRMRQGDEDFYLPIRDIEEEFGGWSKWVDAHKDSPIQVYLHNGNTPAQAFPISEVADRKGEGWVHAGRKRTKKTTNEEGAEIEVDDTDEPTPQQSIFNYKRETAANTDKSVLLRINGRDVKIPYNEIYVYGGLEQWADAHNDGNTDFKVYVKSKDGYTCVPVKGAKADSFMYVKGGDPTERGLVESYNIGLNEVEQLWKEAEEKYKADANRISDRNWSDYAAMGGGREMRVVTTSVDRHEKAVAHLTHFDLETMMNNMWQRRGAEMTQKCLADLKKQYPNADEQELKQYAEQKARWLNDNIVYKYAVQKNTPQSELEYFMRQVMDMNLLVNISRGLDRSRAGKSGDMAAYEQAMGDYAKDHRFTQVAGTVVGMAVDPTTWVSGGVGSAAGKGATTLGAKMMFKEATTEIAKRQFANTLTGRIIAGTAGSMANLATYEGMKEAERQWVHGGYINPETGENEGYSPAEILKSSGHGAVMGTMMGPVTPIIGNTTDKVVKVTNSAGGKVFVRGSEVAISTVAEGTIFSIPEWIEGERDAYDVWTDNMAMMLGFKAQHGIKSAPHVIESLRPIKPAEGRPLTQAERNHNRMNFSERVRKAMDASPSDFAFSKEETEELRKAGYGDLADLFIKDDVKEKRRAKTETADETNIDEAGIELYGERVDAETVHENPEFDGYSDMERLMQDPNVSQAARAKAYYLLTGRMLPMSTITGHREVENEDGTVTIQSVSADGEVITARTFKDNKDAKREINAIQRQAELNTIDVGERYQEAVANEKVVDESLREAIDAFGATQDFQGAGFNEFKKLYYDSKTTDMELSDAQRQFVEMVDEAIERNQGIADSQRPQAIREEINEEFGVDVDKAIKKSPGDRSPREQDAVEEYAKRLFPEEARRTAEETYEPTPEEAQAQETYDAGREVYDTFEQGDPEAQAEAQAEADAIAIRMREAYQLCEEAFGDDAEYWMYLVNENPWSLLNDPDITDAQREAVLYYVNAKAALNGVMDASNEAADRKRQEVQQDIERRTHKDLGSIQPATMKADDKQVYVVKGDVVMFADGTGVDVSNSSQSVVVYDPETGEYKFTAPEMILRVDESINPQDELNNAFSTIEQEQSSIFTESVEDIAEQGDRPEEVPAETTTEDIAEQPTETELPEENATLTDEAVEEQATEEPTQDANPIANVEEYDRGYEEGIEEGANLSDEQLATSIDQLRNGEVTDYNRGSLEALEYEQQRRSMESENNAPETELPEENAEVTDEPQEETALSRIPIDEETQEPMFEKVDKETAWDGLVEAVGEEKDAVDIAQAQIEQARADLEALKKKPPTMKAPKLKGSPMAMAQAKRAANEKYQQDMDAYNQTLADTQTRLDAWNDILGVYTARTAEARRIAEEERRVRDAQAHDEAVARFEEEQRIKAEKEAEQATIGTHAVNPKIKEKWDNSPKVEGHSDIITLPDGSQLRGRYILTEAGAASASHDPNNGYTPTEGFPIDENGQSVNDRDYERDMDAQRIVEDMAGAYDNRALQNPVVVSQDGIVLSGNNRTMSGDLAAVRGTDQAYIDYLKEFGAKYGFTPEQIEGMEHPRVAFVPDEQMPYDATTFSRFNAQEMKSQSKPEAAVKLGKIVPDNVFNQIVNDISGYDRLSDFYADEKAVAHTLGSLLQAGVINDKQMPELRTGNSLSAAGKELIENTLIGKVFQTNPEAVRQLIGMPTVRQSVVMGLSEISANRTLAGAGYDLSEELAKAVDLVTRAKTALPDVFTEGVPVSPFGRQQGLFDDEFGDSRVTDATTLLLADILNSGKPSDLRKVLATYNKDAGQAAAGQLDIFSGEPHSKEEILTNVNNLFKNATSKEQQELINAAIADRKNRAGQESEQTPTVGESDTEGTERAAGNAGGDGERSDNLAEEQSQLDYKLSNEIDENGRQFVLTSSGEIEFGRIEGVNELTDAPILLSEGVITNPKTKEGYGLVHIEARHGDQIRGLGFNSVIDFIEEVAKNYDVIREGKERDGQQTYLLQLQDKHNNTLIVELAGDGTYWNINTAGVFKTSYGRKGKEVYNRHTTEKQPAETAEASQDVQQSGTDTTSSMNAPTLPADKGSENPTDTQIKEPTEAQKLAGNYKKKHIRVDGYDISIENEKGSIRRGKDADGTEWETEMQNDYGYIRGTKGKDGDHIDVYLSDTPEEGDVFVIDQVNADGSFDEHKVMYGFPDIESAREAYLSNYEDGWTGLGTITQVSKDEFKKWVKSSKSKTKPFAEYAGVKQIESQQDNTPAQSDLYTITQTTYTNKKGKTSDIHLVKFNRELSKEEQAALKEFISQPLSEGKKTSKGWYDRKEDGYMMRSEEAAKELAGMIGNDEAVADAQPLTKEDYRNEVAPIEEKPTEPAKPKKSPINRVSIEDVFGDLYQKGETKLSDHATPIEPEKKEPTKDGRSLNITDDMKRDEDILRDILGIGDDEIDPDTRFNESDGLTPEQKRKVFSVGVNYSMGYIEQGIVSFEDFARAMTTRLGGKIKPWLKSFYEGVKRIPGYEEFEFTPSEDVDRFDVENLDRPQADPIKDAEMRVEERKVAKASEQAHKEIKETRNENRKKDEQKTEADTAALAKEAGTVASQARSVAKTSTDRTELNRANEQIDEALEKINDQLALLGFYEFDEDDSKFHESYGYMLTAEKKAVQDASNLAKQIVKDLGIDLKVTSSTTPIGRKAKSKNTAVRSNIAPAGGDVTISLPLNEGRELKIYIGLEPSAGKGVRRGGDNLQVERIMYRVENPNGKGIDQYGNNNWANNDVTYAELLRRLRYVAKDYLPTQTVEEAPKSETPAPKEEPQLPNFPDPKDKDAVSDWLYDKSEAILKGMEQVTEDAVNSDTLLATFRQRQADNDTTRELVVNDFIDDWFVGHSTEWLKDHIETMKAWFDYGQKSILSLPIRERLAEKVANEQKTNNEPPTEVNGYKVGDEVMWDRYGTGKWEKQKIKGFERDGSPILDSFGANWISEVADWDRIKPANGVFGEAERVARQAQAKKTTAPKTEPQPKATPAEVEKIADILNPNRKKKKESKPAVKPEQTIGSLFDFSEENDNFVEPTTTNHGKKTDLQPRSGTAEREAGHEPRPHEPVGTGKRNEDERTDGRGMGGRSAVNPLSDGERSGSVPQPSKSERKPLTRLAEGERKNVNNNHAERGVDYAPKGEDARIKANIEAIELAKNLLASGADATPEQMAVLRKFSGWGGLGKAFSNHDYARRIQTLLGEEAMKDAMLSRNSAYYTPAEVIDTLWDIAQALGFEGGNVLEGSAGIGNILGLMPSELSDRSTIHAVEKDSTTGGILSLLYPDAKVDVQGFEETKIPNNSIDLAITNVPFVTGLRVFDKTGDKDLAQKFRDIHDFCIAKNIRKLREGGIGIFITSNGTMDNSANLRRWITNEGNADVVGAFRMHNETFGGAPVTSDIIVVRKRVNGKPSPNAIDIADVIGVRTAEYDTGETRKVKGKEVPIVKTLSMTYNKYFAEHPENMAGEMHFAFERGETFRPESRGLFPTKDKPQGEMLKQWVERMRDMKPEEQAEKVEDVVTRINERLGEGVKEGSMVLNSDGELCVARMGEAVPLGLNKNKVKGKTKAQCFADYTAIKKALADVLEYQSTHEENDGLDPLLKELNRAFDHFTRTYGNLHKNVSISFLRNDVDFSSIQALETYSEKGDKKGNKVVKVGKTDIFSRRVIDREKEPQPTTIKDGILASLYKSGELDPEYIAEALGKSVEDVKREIVESGLGFENPATGLMEVSYRYLSGNVREKLTIAKENNVDGKYDPNIKALEKAIPMTIPAHLIEFTLGSSWIDPKLYEAFVYDKTGLHVKLTNAGGTWYMDAGWSTYNEKNRAMAVESKLVGKTIFGHELIEAALTNRTITVSKTVKNYDGSTETITDKVATSQCAAKVDELRIEFKDWARERMQKDAEMSARIEETYNEQFNNYVPMTIPEEFVPRHFGGQVSELHGRPFALRPHQGKAVVRGTTEPILLAHEVGTGKTYTLITTAMEMRRLGTAKKPMIVVQNATVGQFVESAKEIYPNAKILTIEDADRTAEGRKNFYAKIKYNDWDMIVVPQSVFERIPDSEEREMAYIQDIIEEKLKVLEDMREADSNGKSMITRQAEKEIEAQQARLNELTEAMETKRKNRDEKREAKTRENAEVRALEMLDREVDDVENFDDMGIDALLVDEAHEYKHLGFATAMQRGVKGVDPSYSKKSQGLFLKSQAVMQKNNGRNVVFATGTPISNTAAEIWTFMRYLMPADTMKSYGIYYFDDFVRNFGNISQMVEFATNGKFKENNRFAGYVNLPELVRIWSSVADTVLTREAGGVSDKIPDMEGGKAQDMYLPQTRALRQIMLYVKEQLKKYEEMSGKEKKENSHIPLVMYGIAKAAAVDARLVVNNAEDDPNSKTNATVRETLRSLEETKKYKGTVAIFADNYQNRASKFNLYDDIRTKLIAAGVPADQIVIIRSGMPIKKKLEIFEKVNAGDIRVIMGSTFTLGTGVNIQERLHTAIHIDAPNRPMDYTQRNGRILRQGNLHKDMGLPVRIIRFGVEDSLDVTAYQRLKTKGAIADSVMNGSKMMQNAMENRVLEEEEDMFGDMTAQLSGSEYAILKNQAEREVRSLSSKQKGHDMHQVYVHNRLPEVERLIRGGEARVELETKNLEILGKHFPDGTFKKITIGKFSFDSIDAMADFFKEQNKKMEENVKKVQEGGTEITSTLTVDIDGLPFEITTKVGRKVADGSFQFEPERKVTYSCEALGIKDVQPNGNRIKGAIEEIVNNIVSGKQSRGLLKRGEEQAARYAEEKKVLEESYGKEFPFKKELEEAKKRLAEYEELMKKELEAKEAKYAEMDAGLEAATDVSLSDEDEDGETNGDGNKYRLVEEGPVLDFLNGQPLKLGYRYAQWADMGIRPPMTAKQNGEWRPPMVMSRWEQSEEGMIKANGKADLVQGNGRTTGDVAYNPYFHIRTSPLNDQFTAAYDRPELLVVEGYYPESEETSGYHAEGAKDSVGLMDWHSGSVNGQLSDETKVQTMLSRYFKPSRIVPWSEVADLIMQRVGNQNITFPINAVPPMLRAELAKRGAKFGDISGSVSDADIPMLNDLKDRINAGEHDAGLEKAQAYLTAYESSPEAKETRVTELAQKMHTPVRILTDQSEIDALPSSRQRRAKGWWNGEGVTIVLPNNVNVADVENTFVHEVVGHDGLRALVGKERMQAFVDEIYDHAGNKIRKEIDNRTQRLVDAEADRLRVRKSMAREEAGEDVNANYFADMADARTEAEAKREQFRREATEEYMSDMAGKIGDEGFERMSREEQTLWGKIKAKVQKFLDMFLRGLKIPKSIKLTDKDLAYILFKSWKNKRRGGGVFAEAEDVSMRRKTGYDADDITRFRDPDMGLEETITRLKTEAMQANTDNLQAKRDAMRAIGGNLNHLRSAMARQREYDITTVKSITDLAKIFLENNLFDDLSKYETKRILGTINNVIGKQDVSKYVQNIMDIMVDNQLRQGANTLGRLLSIRGSRVDARGIEVQGELDPDGQAIAKVVRKSTSLPKDDIDTRISEAINRMGSSDQAIADEATIEYAGLQIARQYVEDITESKAEEKALRDSIKQAKEDYDAGNMTEAAYRQYVSATEDAIRQNKIERAEAFHSLVEQVGGMMSESIERAKAWREAEKQRVEDIQHNANSDMEGRPTDEHHKNDRIQKLSNNSFARFMLAPLATFDQMLRMFGKKNVRGEGYLWNRYMRGWVDATEREYLGYRKALEVLDDKVSEVFGKKMKWGDLFAIDRKLPKATVNFWDGGDYKDHELTQGNLLYIYMADKMADGRMKLRRMGITEEDVADIANFLDPRFIELADWMQEEFLVDKRNEYNEVHKRMFGASMAAIENYFPLKILANARLENIDVADDTTDTALPATSTGSIIKRRRNNLALDVTGANAFSVILDHLQQMERWAAFAEFNRDLNTLLSYKRFRNQVMNMSSVYGGGKTLWNNFRNVCSMAAGAYRPPIAALDKSAVNIAKGVTAAKVSFRVFTALKQFLSLPAYVSDSNPLYLAKNLANPFGAWKWSMENLPIFEKRWKSRMAGDPRLLKSDMDWKMWRSRIVEIASRVGMSPNAFVDALTVAIGSHAMYETKKAKYLRWGMSEADADRRAKQDATILFNQTQQSSEGAFLSTMQVDRSWLSVLFTVFRNSSMSYTRQLYDAMRNLGRYMKPGYADLSEEFMAKQMRRDGIDPDKADTEAKREYRRGILRNLVKVGIFGFALQMLWNLGAYLPYLILGDDEDEKDKMWDDVMNHSMFGAIEGVTGGDVLSSAGNMWISDDWQWKNLSKDMPLSSDIQSILQHWDNDKVSAMNDVINLLVQSGVGVNPQSLTDAVVAVMDYCGDDAQTSRECALLISRILNCPQSQIDKIYFDEIDASAREASQMTPGEIAERYARYKVRRGAPLTGWAYGSEAREKAMNKYRDKSEKIAKERIGAATDKATGADMSQALSDYESVKAQLSQIKRVKNTDEDRYYDLLDEIEATPEFERYEIVKDYKKDVDELTKEWLRAKTVAERDSCAKAIIELKREMVNELNSVQQ